MVMVIIRGLGHAADSKAAEHASRAGDADDDDGGEDDWEAARTDQVLNRAPDAAKPDVKQEASVNLKV